MRDRNDEPNKLAGALLAIVTGVAIASVVIVALCDRC
jgi:hypothetical protein